MNGGNMWQLTQASLSWGPPLEMPHLFFFSDFFYRFINLSNSEKSEKFGVLAHRVHTSNTDRPLKFGTAVHII